MTAAAPRIRDAVGGAPAGVDPAVEWLTDGQRAALARVGCAVERPGGLAVVCGPSGTGITTLLRHLEAAAAPTRTAACRTFTAWESSDPSLWPDTVIVDDAHDAADGALGRMLGRARARDPGVRVVLGGRGRIFTLLARDLAVESQVSLRAVLRPFTATETAALLAGACARAGRSPDALDPVARTIHEIAGGIPAVSLRLAEMALLVAASSGAAPDPDGIEALHRRVSLHAA